MYFTVFLADITFLQNTPVSQMCYTLAVIVKECITKCIANLNSYSKGEGEILIARSSIILLIEENIFPKIKYTKDTKNGDEQPF